MLNETEELLCFAAVTHGKSFTKAAEILGCSKAHISRKVSSLEKRLQTRLLHRSTRQLALTDSGKQLCFKAEKLLSATQNLQFFSRNLNAELAGKFVITAPVSFSTYVLAHELDALHKAFPEIQFELRPTNKIEELIENGIDLAIRTSNVVDTSLVAKQVGTMGEVFLGSDKFFKQDSPESLEDLELSKLLINPCDLKGGQLSLIRDEQMLALEPEQAMLIGDNPIIIEMLFNNSYVGWLPNYCAGIEVNGQKLIEILPEFRSLEWPIFLVFPYQMPMPIKLQKVTAFLQESLMSKFA